MKARVIVTMKCQRHCKNCCNTGDVFLEHEVIDDIESLLSFDEIIITGGEPMLILNEVILFINELRVIHGYSGKIYVYSALYNDALRAEYLDLFKYINGIHFTIHAEATDQEVMELKQLSEILPRRSGLTFRLSIDERLYDRYDFSNIDLSTWSVVRKMKWLVNCKLPADEKLLIYELKQ
jgi:hypothetical protein